MNVSHEIRLSQLLARVEGGNLTLSELDHVAEEAAALIRETSGKVQDFAKNIFEKTQVLKLKNIESDVLKLEQLGELDGRVSRLTLLRDEMNPEMVEGEIEEIAGEFESVGPFFTPQLQMEAKRVKEKFETVEFGHVFTAVRSLDDDGDFARFLENKASQLEGV